MGCDSSTPRVSQPGPPQRYAVKLASTPLGFEIAGYKAYHTSITLNGNEFAFSSRGIVVGQGWQSHAHLRGHPTVCEMGFTSISPAQMLEKLRPHFREGTYDLLRKNCNSYSDCALSLLLDQRLDMKYRTLEKVGAKADQYTNIVKIATGGGYTPNRIVDGWSSIEVIKGLKH